MSSSINSSTSSPVSTSPSYNATATSTTADSDSEAQYGYGKTNPFSTKDDSSVGTSTVGVNVSGDAVDATGANALIIDQTVPLSQSQNNTPNNFYLDNLDLTSPMKNTSITNEMSMDLADDLEKISGPLSVFSTAVMRIANRIASKPDGSQGDSTSKTTATTGSSSSSNTSDTQSTSDTPPPTNSSSYNPFSFENILDEIGSMEAQQSETMAVQAAANTDAIELNASRTDDQADQMIIAANVQMDSAFGALVTGGVSAGVAFGGLGSADSEASEADLAAQQEDHSAMGNLGTDGLRTTTQNLDHPSGTNLAESNKFIADLRKAAAKPHVNPAAAGHATQTANHLEGANNYATYLRGGKNEGEECPPPVEKIEDPNDPKKTIDRLLEKKEIDSRGAVIRQRPMTPQEAVDYLMLKAKESSAKLTESVKPENLKGQLRTNKNSHTYSAAFQNKNNWFVPFTTLAQSASTMANTMGQSESQIHQAQGTIDSAAAQTAQATEQAMGQGESQTQSLAEALRSDSTSIAGDMVQLATDYHAA